jgi:hypothetical protein
VDNGQLVTAMSHDEIIRRNEADIARLMNEMAERAALPVDACREWQTPQHEPRRRLTEPVVVRAVAERVAERMIAEAIAQLEERLEARLIHVAQILGEESGLLLAPVENRLVEVERAVSWLPRKEG